MNNDSLNKKDLERVRKANAMKKLAAKSDEFKLCYFPGANLVLLQQIGSVWYVKMETGKYFDNVGERTEIQ